MYFEIQSTFNYVFYSFKKTIQNYGKKHSKG